MHDHDPLEYFPLVPELHWRLVDLSGAADPKAVAATPADGDRYFFCRNSTLKGWIELIPRRYNV